MFLFKDAKGKVAHDFKGRLSFSWPNAACLVAPIAKMEANHPEKKKIIWFGIWFELRQQIFCD